MTLSNEIGLLTQISVMIECVYHCQDSMFSTEAAFGVTSTPCILLVLLRPLKARTRQPFGVFGESPIFGFMLQYEKGFFSFVNAAGSKASATRDSVFL